jgi:ADP-ribose pyrophosphatase YjhB (NUDIX family)
MVIYKILKMETFGVRVALIKNNSEILLIKHQYDDFWVLPGGGIKKKEVPEKAARREVQEEVGFIIENLELLGKYKNISGGKNDNVFVFISRNFKKSLENKSFLDKLEVQKQKWFSYRKLPEISPATKKRLKEIFENKPKPSKLQW